MFNNLSNLRVPDFFILFLVGYSIISLKLFSVWPLRVEGLPNFSQGCGSLPQVIHSAPLLSRLMVHSGSREFFFFLPLDVISFHGLFGPLLIYPRVEM